MVVSFPVSDTTEHGSCTHLIEAFSQGDRQVGWRLASTRSPSDARGTQDPAPGPRPAAKACVAMSFAARSPDPRISQWLTAVPPRRLASW